MCTESRRRPVGLETTAEDEIREGMGGPKMKIHSKCDSKSLKFFEQKNHDLTEVLKKVLRLIHRLHTIEKQGGKQFQLGLLVAMEMEAGKFSTGFES